MSSFNSVNFGDFPSTQIQDAIRSFADGLDSRVLRGRLIEAQSFASGETKMVPHGLNRTDVRVMPLNVRAHPCSFRAFLSADQTGIAANTNVDIDFDTESWNYGDVFDPVGNTFTAPVSGVYSFSSNLYFLSIAAGSYASPRLNAGGTDYVTGFHLESSTTGAYIIDAQWTLALTAGDSAFVKCLHNSSSAATLSSGQARTWFSGQLLGSPMPYVDAGSDANLSRFIPIHAERSLTCDLWVY